MRGRKAVLAASVAALVLAADASAHAVVSPPVALAKVLQQFALSVPTEKDGVTTTHVELALPSGFSIDSFEPAPGWTRQVHGQTVIWSGGHTPTEEDSVFRFNASATAARTYVFTVRQTYSDGSVVEWSGPESSDTPAPVVEARSSFGGGGGSSTLEIVALIVGAAGVVLGIVALATQGRPLA
jgi:uncharacterized protein YcnI